MVSFGQKIKKLRTEAGFSQTYLAEHIGVSTQSVSNWECDNTMPDISQIVPLAGILKVSTDFLLGVGMDEKSDLEILKKKVGSIWATYSVNTVENNADLQVIGLYKDYLRKYPMNYEIKYKCSLAMHDYLIVGSKRGKFKIATKDFDAIYDECQKLLIAICNNATDIENRIKAKKLLIQHMILGEKYDEAVRIAAKLPIMGGLRNEAMSEIYYEKGDMEQAKVEAMSAGEKKCYEYLMSLFTIAKNTSGDEKISLLQKAEIASWHAVDLFTSKFDIGVNDYQNMPYCYLITAFSMCSNEYLKMNQKEQALECLEKATDVACSMCAWVRQNCTDEEVLSDYAFFAKSVPHWCFSFSGIYNQEKNEFSNSETYVNCEIKIDKAIKGIS